MERFERKKEGKTGTARREIMPSVWKVRVTISTKVMVEVTFQLFSSRNPRALGPFQVGYSTV